MKACIVTVYNSENCGSFWQAFAMQEYLKGLGFDVYFHQREMKGASHTLPKLAKRVGHNLKKGNFRMAIGEIKKYNEFERAISNFNIVPECGEDFSLCLLGSDTIWNLNSEYFKKNRKIYWGNTSKAEMTIAYAASLANTTRETVLSFPELKDYAGQLDGIAVRDKHSLAILSEMTGRKIDEVCDPTVLFDKTFYQKQLPRKKDSMVNGKFVFLYYFGKMPEDLAEAVKEYAKNNDCSIVSMGENMVKGSTQIEPLPYNFLYCFENSELVVTNTFHGTIFTLLFEKKAVFNSAGKNKVKDMLIKCGIEDHDCYSKQDPGRLFETSDFDYSGVRTVLEELRNSSMAYIRKYVPENTEKTGEAR